MMGSCGYSAPNTASCVLISYVSTLMCLNAPLIWDEFKRHHLVKRCMFYLSVPNHNTLTCALKPAKTWTYLTRNKVIWMMQSESSNCQYQTDVRSKRHYTFLIKTSMSYWTIRSHICCVQHKLCKSCVSWWTKHRAIWMCKITSFHCDRLDCCHLRSSCHSLGIELLIEGPQILICCLLHI